MTIEKYYCAKIPRAFRPFYTPGHASSFIDDDSRKDERIKSATGDYATLATSSQQSISI